ncbi:MAG: hypothetical protein KJZ80_08765 [Hyphomicrobiaceae bacterium]|nr:hypothetical protein [Hyphomicrobiaceae bacterium]
MKRVRAWVVGAVLVVASSAAMAFDVQQGARAPSAPETKAAPLKPDSSLGADLSLSEDSKAPTGTEVRIPGLGRLGVLPKMDFGLELLYGATDPKQPDAQPENPADGVVVRGTVKHRF